jgi:hypothetical protein
MYRAGQTVACQLPLNYSDRRDLLGHSGERMRLACSFRRSRRNELPKQSQEIRLSGRAKVRDSEGAIGPSRTGGCTRGRVRSPKHS